MTSEPGANSCAELYVADGFNLAKRNLACIVSIKIWGTYPTRDFYAEEIKLWFSHWNLNYKKYGSHLNLNMKKSPVKYAMFKLKIKYIICIQLKLWFDFVK